MTKLEFVQQRITQLRTFLLSGNPVTSLSYEGRSVTYDRSGAQLELKDLENQEQMLLYGKRWIRKIDMTCAEESE
jgi:hypothetical protein